MLVGRLVRLRPVLASDLPAMRRWFSDPEVMRYWGHHRPFTTEKQFESDLDGRFSRFEDSGYFTVLDPDERPIGRIDFDLLDRRAKSAEIGILIGEVSSQGKGYGSDAMVTLMRYLFRDRNLHRVELTVFTTNERAIRAYDRIGFQREGVLRDHRFVGDSYAAELQMGMLRNEFDTRFPDAD